MNILIITGSLSGGGTERVSVILANYLCDEGYNVNIAAFYSNESHYTVSDNITIYKLPDLRTKSTGFINRYINSIKDYRSLKKIIKDNNIKTVISFCSTLPVILFLLATEKINMISTKRNYPPASSRLRTCIEIFIFNRSKNIVFQTLEQMNFYNKKIREKGIIIPNPIHENLPAQYIGQRRKEIVTFCRIARQKNLIMLINGFTKFNSNFKDYKLTIYGNCSSKDIPYKNQLINLIAERKMNHIIKIEEFNLNIHNLVFDSACFVLTSNFEGLSNSMLEAMAMGLPVICTDCYGGGAKTFIKNYENGILIPVNDEEALCNALVYIASNPEKAQEMGNKATKIKETLSQRNICKQWKNILDEQIYYPTQSTLQECR